MPTNAVKLHRVLKSTPERVYRALLDPEAMVKWLPPHGFTGKVHSIEPRVGGTYKMSFKNFTTGESHSFGGKYLELVPNERIRNTDRFDDTNLPGEMVTRSSRSRSASSSTSCRKASRKRFRRKPATWAGRNR